jgi:hypothetical protein
MANLEPLSNSKTVSSSSGLSVFLSIIKFSKLDIYSRLVSFFRNNSLAQKNIWWMILLSCALQTACEYLPFVSWISWPFLVYLCAQSLKDYPLSNQTKTQHILHILKMLKSKGEVLIALLLYGALSLIIFRGFMEALTRLRIDWDVLPSSVITLLPFTLSEAFSVLFIATCAFRINLNDRDPFKILSLALLDLLYSPVSTVLILLIQSTVWTAFAMSVTMYLRAPVISTFLGHAPFILFVLIWLCGQSTEQEKNSETENLQ